MKIDLTGKVALVTASTGGIGLAIARGLAESGAEVILNGRSQESVNQGIQQLQQAVPTICPVSVGACLVEPEQDWNDWYARADAALYESKRLGGNRAFWIDGLPPLPGG